MGRTTQVRKPVDREQIVRLLDRLPKEDSAGQLRTASRLAWIGIQARRRNTAVRGRLNAAARGRVDATHFAPALDVFASLPQPARCEMALALGDLAGSVAVDKLITMVTSVDADARLVAVDALGKIGGPQAVAVLKQATQDADESVRAEAARSLGQLAVAELEKEPGELKESTVEAWLLGVAGADTSEYVRQVATEALSALREAQTLRGRREAEGLRESEISVPA